jgi:TPR repeat protein
MYLTGQGVQRSPREAARWFARAVKQGNSTAAILLGRMYWNGDGVAHDHERAAQVWLIAAREHNASAPALLADYYFTLAAASAQQHVLLMKPALRAVYWGELAIRVDPDTAAQQKGKRLVEMLLSVAPALGEKANVMLARHAPPSG